MIEGRIVDDFGVTTLPSFVTKRKFAPPVSSTNVSQGIKRESYRENPEIEKDLEM